MQQRRARGLAGAAAAARQVVEVGLRHRHRRVGLAQRRDLRRLRVHRSARLVPRPEHPRRVGDRRLPPGPRREARQRVDRARPGEDQEAQLARRGPRRLVLGRALHGEAPGVGACAAEVVVGGLVVGDDDAVAAARQQPRDREVGRVGTAPEAGRRQQRADAGPLVLAIGPVGDVALDRGAAVLDGVRRARRGRRSARPSDACQAAPSARTSSVAPVTRIVTSMTPLVAAAMVSSSRRPAGSSVASRQHGGTARAALRDALDTDRLPPAGPRRESRACPASPGRPTARPRAACRARRRRRCAAGRRRSARRADPTRRPRPVRSRRRTVVPAARAPRAASRRATTLRARPMRAHAPLTDSLEVTPHRRR